MVWLVACRHCSGFKRGDGLEKRFGGSAGWSFEIRDRLIFGSRKSAEDNRSATGYPPPYVEPVADRFPLCDRTAVALLDTGCCLKQKTPAACALSGLNAQQPVTQKSIRIYRQTQMTLHPN